MEKDEVLDLIADIKTVWPNCRISSKYADGWHRRLQNFEGGIVRKALEKYINEHPKTPPNLWEIEQQAKKLLNLTSNDANREASSSLHTTVRRYANAGMVPLITPHVSGGYAVSWMPPERARSFGNYKRGKYMGIPMDLYIAEAA